MGNMPDVMVEVAFDSGYATPAASRTWTDVSDKVELAQGVTITYGRQDESSAVDANQMTLTLDNKDGRFTAKRVASMYYPNVKLGRPIRLTTTPPGGSPSVRFVGYVDEWPTAWNGTDAYAYATITAHSRTARLGFDLELGSLIDEEYGLDAPLGLYTLSEPAESVVGSDSSGNGQPQLTQVVWPLSANIDEVTFGAEIPTLLPMTGALFSGLTKSLQALLDSPPSIAGATLEFWVSDAFNTPNVQLGGGRLAVAASSLVFASFTPVAVSDSAGTTITASTPSVTDGLPHHVAITTSTVAGTTTLSVYLDGALFSSNTGALVAGALSPLLSMGGAQAVFANVAVYGTALSPARIASHAEAGSTGFAGESASDRVTRFASYGGIDAAEVTADAGTTPVDPYDTTGHTAIDSMRAVEESEGGVLHDGRDNGLVFKGRASRYSVASAFTVSATLQQIEADVAPKLDRTGLVNDATITASDGSTARATNPTSLHDYGSAKGTGNVLGSNDVALQAAYWQVNTYGEPQPRIPALGVNFIALFADAALQAAILDADIGTRLTSAGLPDQAQAASLDFFLEGYTETIGRASYGFVFNVSPVLGFDVWTIEDPVFGEYDAYPIAY